MPRMLHHVFGELTKHKKEDNQDELKAENSQLTSDYIEEFRNRLPSLEESVAFCSLLYA